MNYFFSFKKVTTKSFFGESTPPRSSTIFGESTYPKKVDWWVTFWRIFHNCARNAKSSGKWLFIFIFENFVSREMCKTIVLMIYFFILPLAGLFVSSATLDQIEDENDQDFCRKMIWIIYGLCKSYNVLEIFVIISYKLVGKW